MSPTAETPSGTSSTRQSSSPASTIRSRKANASPAQTALDSRSWNESSSKVTAPGFECQPWTRVVGRPCCECYALCNDDIHADCRGGLCALERQRQDTRGAMTHVQRPGRVI